MRLDRYSTTATIRRGKLKVSNGTQWIEALRQFPEGPVTVTVQRQHATRSLQSNAFYWGVVVKTISDYTGYSPDETHQALKALHLPKHLAFADGNGEVVGELVIGGSTRVLNQAEFSDFISRVKTWSHETLGITFPND
jgi:hypothetical protein